MYESRFFCVQVWLILFSKDVHTNINSGIHALLQTWYWHSFIERQGPFEGAGGGDLLSPQIGWGRNNCMTSRTGHKRWDGFHLSPSPWDHCSDPLGGFLWWQHSQKVLWFIFLSSLLVLFQVLPISILSGVNRGKYSGWISLRGTRQDRKVKQDGLATVFVFCCGGCVVFCFTTSPVFAT